MRLTLISGKRATLKKGAHPLQGVLDDTYLFVERCKDVASIDANALAENYADGKVVLYVRLRDRAPHRRDYNFSFLITKDVLELGWTQKQLVEVATAKGKAVAKEGIDCDEAFPVLVGIGDFVDCPKGVISSGVWALVTDEFPLLGSELLFQSVLTGHPRVWEFVWLPGVAIDATKWKPYARRALAVSLDQRHGCLIKRGSQAKDKINHVEGDVDVEVFLSACDYVREVRFLVEAERVGIGLQEPIDGQLEVSKLAHSTGNIFL